MRAMLILTKIGNFTWNAVCITNTSTLDARGFYLLERRNTARRREKPLVQAVEFFENAGPMGCRFIFPESDFDPSNSIGSRNMSVLSRTLIGLAAESSSNRFSILLSTLFPAATGYYYLLFCTIHIKFTLIL